MFDFMAKVNIFIKMSNYPACFHIKTARRESPTRGLFNKNDANYFFASWSRMSMTWMALLDTFVPGPNTAMAPASKRYW